MPEILSYVAFVFGWAILLVVPFVCVFTYVDHRYKFFLRRLHKRAAKGGTFNIIADEKYALITQDRHKNLFHDFHGTRAFTMPLKDEVNEWCDTYTRGWFMIPEMVMHKPKGKGMVETCIIGFDHPEDAVAFKMRWY